jgi:hypothetical protein
MQPTFALTLDDFTTVNVRMANRKNPYFKVLVIGAGIAVVILGVLAGRSFLNQDVKGAIKWVVGVAIASFLLVSLWKANRDMVRETKRRLFEDTKNQVARQRTVRIEDTGLSDECEGITNVIKWSSARDVVDLGNYVVVVHGVDAYFFVPKRAFAGANEYEEFVQAARARLEASKAGHRAML